MSLNVDEEERLTALLEELEGNRKFLSDWEQSFLTDQQKRYEQYGAKIFLSPKQSAVLIRMQEKIRKV